MRPSVLELNHFLGCLSAIEILQYSNLYINNNNNYLSIHNNHPFDIESNANPMNCSSCFKFGQPHSISLFDYFLLTCRNIITTKIIDSTLKRKSHTTMLLVSPSNHQHSSLPPTATIHDHDPLILQFVRMTNISIPEGLIMCAHYVYSVTLLMRQLKFELFNPDVHQILYCNTKGLCGAGTMVTIFFKLT